MAGNREWRGQDKGEGGVRKERKKAKDKMAEEGREERVKGEKRERERARERGKWKANRGGLSYK